MRTILSTTRNGWGSLSAGLRGLAEHGAPIAGLRGRGLMLGVLLDRPIAPQVVRAALGHGLIVNATGDQVLRLVPPLILTESEANEAVRRLGSAMEEV